MNEIEILLETTLRTLPPVLLAGLGGMLANRVGILNLGLEGMMLTGSFVGVIASYYTGSAYSALLIAGLASALVGLLFSLFTIRFKANPTVVGVAVNMLVAGLSTYFLSVLFGVRGSFSDGNIVGLPKISIPFLENIPILRIFNNQNLTVWLAIVFVAALQYVFYHTPLGLRIRATGQFPMAVTTAGVNVRAVQYGALVFGAFLCGLGGAHLSLGQLTMFTENMTSGRGFIALAAAIFGKNTPLGTLVGALLFSFTDGVTRKIQTSGFPSMLIDMIPYVVTVVTLWLVEARAAARRRSLLNAAGIKNK